jgi:hypothetical protein
LILIVANELEVKVKVKKFHYRPGQALRVPGSRFIDNQHMKVVRLSALFTP